MQTKNTRQLTSRQLDQQQRVFACLRQMLAETGYEGLQMRRLAEQAGVAPMTLYNRFGNKDDLILLALREMLDGLGERARSSGLQGIAFTLHNAEIIAEQILTTPEYARAMALMLFNGNAGSPIVQLLLANNVEQARMQIEQMRALGELDDKIDTTVLARGLGVSGWSSIMLWMKQLIPDQEFVHAYRRAPLLVLAGAMTPAARRRYADELQPG